MNQEKNTMFMRLHPIVNFLYFIIIMFLTMFELHPILLSITCIICLCYQMYLDGWKQAIASFKLLPFLLGLSLVNPLFNQNGKTVLWILGKRKITLEAILYGMVAAEMIFAMILLFRIFHMIMESEKIMCILSKGFPIGALLFTMTLRFVPMYKTQLIKMQTAQKGIGCKVENLTRMQKIRNGVELLSGLMTWALESALETAKTMKGRGFGLSGRTFYTNTEFTKTDGVILGIEIFCGGILFIARTQHCFQISYYPTIIWGNKGVLEMLYYGVYTFFVAIPLLVDLKEEIIWHYLRQNI